MHVNDIPVDYYNGGILFIFMLTLKFLTFDLRYLAL